MSIRLAGALGLLDSAEDLDTDIDEYASIRLAEALGLLDSAEDLDTGID